VKINDGPHCLCGRGNKPTVQARSVPAAEKNLFTGKRIVGRIFTPDLIGIVKCAVETTLKKDQPCGHPSE
jgi:hypothetical protein